MNKRQKKKQYKKAMEEFYSNCENCGNPLDLKNNWYHNRYGTCNEICYARLVCADFY